MADKFKCPNCSSGRTKPLLMAIAGGTRRRQTVGFSRRSLWTSSSTYKSDLVSSLPQRPSNGTAHLLIFMGVCGLLLALFVGANERNAVVFTMFISAVSVLLLLGGIGAKKPDHYLINQQSAWDKSWLCARCGHIFIP
jgi:hypothetical protein